MACQPRVVIGKLLRTVGRTEIYGYGCCYAFNADNLVTTAVARTQTAINDSQTNINIIPLTPDHTLAGFPTAVPFRAIIEEEEVQVTAILSSSDSLIIWNVLRAAPVPHLILSDIKLQAQRSAVGGRQYLAKRVSTKGVIRPYQAYVIFAPFPSETRIWIEDYVNANFINPDQPTSVLAYTPHLLPPYKIRLNDEIMEVTDRGTEPPGESFESGLSYLDVTRAVDGSSIGTHNNGDSLTVLGANYPETLADLHAGYCCPPSDEATGNLLAGAKIVGKYLSTRGDGKEVYGYYHGCRSGCEGTDTLEYTATVTSVGFGDPCLLGQTLTGTIGPDGPNPGGGVIGAGSCENVIILILGCDPCYGQTLTVFPQGGTKAIISAYATDENVDTADRTSTGAISSRADEGALLVLTDPNGDMHYEITLSYQQP